MAGNKEFGKHLKRLREINGLSQEKLAELIGLEYQTISRIETGLYFTSIENLQKIAKVLNLQIKDLFDFQEKEFEREQLIELIMNDINLFDKKDLINIKKIINAYKDALK